MEIVKSSSSGISVESETEEFYPSFTKEFDLISESQSLVDFDIEQLLHVALRLSQILKL